MNLHLPALPAVELYVSDGVAGRVLSAIQEPTEWQRIGN